MGEWTKHAQYSLSQLIGRPMALFVIMARWRLWPRAKFVN